MARIIENPKQLILNTAKEILFESGYDKLSIRAVAGKCGIAVGTVYNYFPDKKELIIEMMAGYWDEFINSLNFINYEEGFFNAIYKVYIELKSFLKNFKTIWLIPSLYNNPDYVQGGVKKEQIYIGKLVSFVEELIVKCNMRTKFSTHETAKFIVLNIVSLIQMPIMSYDSFEKFLNEILIA